MRPAAGAAFHETRLGEILVGLRDRHVVDAELLGQPPHRRQPCTGRQFARRDAGDDLLVQLHENRAATALRQRNPERVWLGRLPRMPLAVRHFKVTRYKKSCMILCMIADKRKRKIV
jgi:hypothetical protein